MASEPEPGTDLDTDITAATGAAETIVAATVVAVTVVVVTWNGAHLLPDCLGSLRRQTAEHRVVVVDNASTDGTAELLAEQFPEAVRLSLPRNLGFAGGVAAALDTIDTPYVALLNNDATAEPGWLAALIAAAGPDPDGPAAVTSRILLRASGRINNAGGALTRLGIGYDRGLDEPDGPPFDRPVSVAAFCGGAALLRTSAVRAVGGIAADFFLYYEDTDLSWRLRRAGYAISYAPDAVVHHQHSATSDQGSAGFAYYNLRNQLLTVIRNAPAGVVARVGARFVLVSVLDGIRSPARLRGRSAGPFQHRPGLRLRVLGGVLRRLPAAWAERRRTADGPISRSEFAADWLGTPARDQEPVHPRL